MSAACLVADSGPLIALARLDLLGLPSRYFEPVLVTSLVWLEVTRKPGVDEADSSRRVTPLAIGAAMGERLQQHIQYGRRRGAAVRRHEARDAAHQ